MNKIQFKFLCALSFTNKNETTMSEEGQYIFNTLGF